MKKILFLVVACAVTLSCSTGDPASILTGRSSRALVFLDCKAVSELEIEFDFSQPVKVTYLNLEPAVKIASIEDGKPVKVRLEEGLAPGMLLTADMLAQDERKNTINVLVPFRARNNRVPKLVINELRPIDGSSNNRCEFVEFKTLTAGNLGALRVFITSNTKQPLVYQFLPVEVKQGELITLNLRTREAECKNEYGSLSESGGKNSSPDGRDFWVPGSNRLLRETDAVYILDQDDNALAAVMISKEPGDSWGKPELEEAALFLFEKGAWMSPDKNVCTPSHAVNSATTTNTRTICRDEKVANTNTKAEWYVTVGSGYTPGKPNNPGRYSP